MRKYQQLVLLLLSSFSIGVLFMYKSENNRLKYVLQAVNFFGRNDAAVLRQIDNATREIYPDYMYPMPLWQPIGNSFYSYSGYWLRNELVAGGDSLVLVAGKRGAVINFKCGFVYEDGSRSVQGKFRFSRIDSNTEDEFSEFTLYNFYCRLVRDFGQPERVYFIDVTSAEKKERSVKLRSIKNEGDSTLFSVCLDLFNFNRTSLFGKVETNLMQFFITHRSAGIENILVYNSDMLPRNVEHSLHRGDVNLHLMPFNFPFSAQNSSERIRYLIEKDCLLRNSNRAKFTLLLSPDEFFYTSHYITNANSVVRSLNHYASDVQRFQVPVFSVCLDDKNKLLIDNNHYDPEFHEKHHIYIYRLPLPIQQVFLDHKDFKSVALTVTNVMGHHYVRCQHVGTDGLRLWKSMLRDDFMKNLDSIRYRVDLLA